MTEQETKYLELKKFILQLPDEMTRDFENELTNKIMSKDYVKLVTFLESKIKDEENDQIAYAIFLMCSIYYRREKERRKQKNLLNQYKARFVNHASYMHFDTLSYVDAGYLVNWRDILKQAKDSALFMGHCGAKHLFAELVAMTFEYENHDADEKEFGHWIEEAKIFVDEAIMENPNYAKFYCTKGRIYSLMDKEVEAERLIRLAIEKEDSGKDDYTLRIGNYQFYLLKVQSHADRNRLKEQINVHQKKMDDAIVDVNQRAESMDKSLMRNLEYLGLFSGIISFTMGTINFASSLASKSFAGAAALIIVLFGVLVGVFAMFDLIIHGVRKDNWKVYLLVFVVVVITIVGGFGVCLTI